MKHCDQDDDRNADSAELMKLAAMVQAFGFHGFTMLSKPCPKCKGLHHWRMISTLPPQDGSDVQRLLRHAADMMDEGIPEAFDLKEAAPQ
jgi:hypothetical protein